MTESLVPLRVAIVDDEPLARAVLREFLSTEPGVEVVAECANGFEAVKAVSELSPDLLLLDVQMPKLDGFEVLDLVGREVAVVFTTAYDQYALRAFEVHAVDYLLKPVSAERLGAALVRVRERLGRGERFTPPGMMAAARPPEGRAHRVLVRDGPRVHVIPVDKIDYVQAQDDYVCFRSEGKDYLKEQTLAETEAALDPARLRPHPPLVSAQPVAPRAGRSGRTGEPRGGAHRRPPPACQPRRLRAPERAVVDRPSGLARRPPRTGAARNALRLRVRMASASGAPMTTASRWRQKSSSPLRRASRPGTAAPCRTCRTSRRARHETRRRRWRRGDERRRHVPVAEHHAERRVALAGEDSSTSASVSGLNSSRNHARASRSTGSRRRSKS